MATRRLKDKLGIQKREKVVVNAYANHLKNLFGIVDRCEFPVCEPDAFTGPVFTINLESE